MSTTVFNILPYLFICVVKNSYSQNIIINNIVTLGAGKCDRAIGHLHSAQKTPLWHHQGQVLQGRLQAQVPEIGAKVQSAAEQHYRRGKHTATRQLTRTG